MKLAVSERRTRDAAPNCADVVGGRLLKERHRRECGPVVRCTPHASETYVDREFVPCPGLMRIAAYIDAYAQTRAVPCQGNPNFPRQFRISH